MNCQYVRVPRSHSGLAEHFTGKGQLVECVLRPLTRRSMLLKPHSIPLTHFNTDQERLGADADAYEPERFIDERRHRFAEWKAGMDEGMSVLLLTRVLAHELSCRTAFSLAVRASLMARASIERDSQLALALVWAGASPR